VKVHKIEMIRNRICVDLESALFFWKSYVESIIKALETYFHDNDIHFAFKILNLSHMSSKRLGLASLGVIDLRFVLKHYGL